MDNIITLQNLSYNYEDDGSEVIKDISFSVKRGEFVALLGHNGSGKSTVAKHLNAIVLPTGGKVYVDGMDTADEELLTQIRTTVGLVFQNPDNQISFYSRGGCGVRS